MIYAALLNGLDLDETKGFRHPQFYLRKKALKARMRVFCEILCSFANFVLSSALSVFQLLAESSEIDPADLVSRKFRFQGQILLG